jgi:tRNA-specific 2-thiouridylase
VGRHDGTWRYTTGQRRGIGIAAPEALYALRTESRTNTLVVGPRDSLGVRRIEAVGRLYVPVDRADVKVRHRCDPVPALVEPTGDGFVLRLDRPAHAVAPGQVAVLYDGDAVIGAGSIVAASG